MALDSADANTTAVVTEVIPRQIFAADETLSAPVAITTGPRSLDARIDATGYPPGTELEIALQYQLDQKSPWQEVSARVVEQGKARDGSPALFWEVGVAFSDPLPDTTLSRVAVRVQKGPGLTTSASIVKGA